MKTLCESQADRLLYYKIITVVQRIILLDALLAHLWCAYAIRRPSSVVCVVSSSSLLLITSDRMSFK